MDADFDEGNPAEEADQAATLPPADSTMSQHDSTLEPATAQPASSDPGGGVAAGDAVDPPCVTGKLCSVCGAKADAKWLICGCGARSHIECMAKRFLQVWGVMNNVLSTAFVKQGRVCTTMPLCGSVSARHKSAGRQVHLACFIACSASFMLDIGPPDATLQNPFDGR